MYEFYEKIKNEVDLQDLVLYLNEPLNKLKVLQIKLQEYKLQNNQENKIEIEEIIRETDKLEKIYFPDLFNNYFKLSLEFRNKVIIKEFKDNEGNTTKYTSKDLLLKNVAKLIEHIQLLEEKFYAYFSFDFLVNSRIISDLGFQKNYLDEKHTEVVLENKYHFCPEDASKIIKKEIEKTIPKNLEVEKVSFENIKEEKADTFINTGAALQVQNAIKKEEQDVIFDKKSIDTIEEKTGGMSLMEVLLIMGFLALGTIGIFTVYSKIEKQEQQFETQLQQEPIKVPQPVIFEKQLDPQKVLEELAANREKMGYVYGAEEPYRQSVILVNLIQNWRDVTLKNNIKNQEINFANLLTTGFNLKSGQILASPKDMIYEGKTYHIDLIDNKAEVKISNVNQNECKYIGIKMSEQMRLKANDKTLVPDNLKTVCELNNIMTMTEK